VDAEHGAAHPEATVPAFELACLGQHGATETRGGFPLESLIQGLPLMPTTLSYALKYWLWKLHGIEGGDAPTDAPLSEDLLPEAAFEDIFGESTGGRFEDILT